MWLDNHIADCKGSRGYTCYKGLEDRGRTNNQRFDPGWRSSWLAKQIKAVKR